VWDHDILIPFEPESNCGQPDAALGYRAGNAVGNVFKRLSSWDTQRIVKVDKILFYPTKFSGHHVIE